MQRIYDIFIILSCIPKSHLICSAGLLNAHTPVNLNPTPSCFCSPLLKPHNTQPKFTPIHSPSHSPPFLSVTSSASSHLLPPPDLQPSCFSA